MKHAQDELVWIDMNDLVELKQSAAKALVRRFLVVLGITLAVGVILTWIENRVASDEPTEPTI